MKVTKIRFISESAAAATPAPPEEAFCTCMAILVLEVHDGNDMSKLRAPFRKLCTVAQTFAKRWGFGAEFRAVADAFNSGVDLHANDPEVVELARLIGKKKSEMEDSPRLKTDYSKFILACASVIRTDNPKNWEYLERHVGVTRDRRLIEDFIPEAAVEERKEASKGAVDASAEMRAVYKRLTGKDPSSYGYGMPFAQEKELRAEGSKDYLRFVELRRALEAEVKLQVMSIVRKTGEDFVLVDKVVKALDAKRLVHRLPRGMVGGFMNDKMEYFTPEKRRLNGIIFGKVRLNPKYDPDTDDTYYLYVEGVGKNDRGNGEMAAGRIRTDTMGKARKVRRHAIAREFMDGEAQMRKRWLAHLKDEGSKEQIMAAMMDILYVTSARIGGKNNKTAGETTYGLTTLLPGHIKVKANEIEFMYPGKKQTPQPARYPAKTPESKKVAAIVKRLVERADSDEYVFDWRGHITRHAMSAYMKKVTGLPTISPHTIRRANGTRAAAAAIVNNPFAARQKKGEVVKAAEVHKWLESKLTAVGKLLNHHSGEKVTAATAIRAYIDPDLLLDFYDKLNLKPHKEIRKD